MASTTPLSEIPTLTLLYKLHKLDRSDTASSSATSRFNDKISIVRKDITKLETDAIVNAANESLLGGGGVDGAIHAAAGPDLLDECRELEGCDTGSAKITDAYELPCKKVIHAVGPVYGSAKRKGLHAELLSGCYTKSLELAVENKCKSLAFSALSTGVYGYPSGEAAETAIQAVKGWLEENDKRAEKIERVVFCQFMEKDQKAYENYIPKYFPPAAEKKAEESEEKVDAEEDGQEGADEAKDEEVQAEKVPDLPEVPTKEPAEPDEPEPKKQKLDDGKD
ncbi:hypothetical protein M409DRAFT_70906 [Zasmidium cellare ATCC 36951]|uniref:Macro domain-containing protein n=1 Tax=Zasmidium cellare ATCC 36951 TaxID=1080233 RepID=A0A6A6BYA3_ZASCE|nr:uncharacterized protein M409DRAFT_70906 [Zasmidium cellare ATCC 36951]KAF2159583.1 hypothetical protein M409DRAFT_70906 [Zasmidium cellare ATCC 36951]